MRKGLLFFFLALFFINSVFALDCQYKVNESYEFFELGLYNSEGEYRGSPLEFREFGGGGFNLDGCRPPSFKIYNTLKTDISLNVSYSTVWNKAIGGAVSKPHQTEISISKYSESDKILGTCVDIGSGSISQESIKYLITEPELITLENELVTKQREICKTCGNEVCLNDGASCNPLYDDSKCGSEICNIAGFCGSQKVVDCPNGRLNCQDKICLEPSTKEEGESYMCSFECKSDRFEDGKCLMSSNILKRNWIIFLVIVFIISSVLVAKFALIPYIKRRKDEENKKDEAKKQREDEEVKREKVKAEYDNLVINKEETENAIKENNQNLEDLKKEREEIEKSLVIEKEKSKKKIEEIKRKEGEEIRKWEEKKKNKSIEAKEEIDREIAKIRKERQNEIKALEKESVEKLNYLKKSINQNEILKLEEEEIKNKLSQSISKMKEKIKEIDDKSPEIRRRDLEDDYNSKYGHRNTKVFYDKERKSFRIKFPNGKTYDLYWWIYKEKIDSNLLGKHIHHINYDEEIDEPWNLIALSEKDHNKIRHANVDKGDWESGIKEIKRALNWEDSDFPEHIRKEIENKRKQKRLEFHSRRSLKKSHKRRR